MRRSFPWAGPRRNILMAKILIIDDEADLLKALDMIFKSRGHDVTALGDASTAGKLISKTKFDVIISDIRMQPMDGLQFLDFLHQHEVTTPVIMLTAHATLDVALQAIKKGAFDFITKPFNPEDLLDLVQQVLDQPIINGSDISLDEAIYSKWLWHGIIARSRQMQDVCRSIERIAPTRESVLLLGEEGTGKSFAAETIHNLSRLSKKTFFSLDCASFAAREGAVKPENRENELLAKIERHTEGTILIENIDLLSEQTVRQAISIIQSKTGKRLNETTPPPASDIRFLASCRQPKPTANRLQSLAVLTIALPPLRARRQDVLPLISSLINKENAPPADSEPWAITADAYKALVQYSWPKNISELREVLNAAGSKAGKRKLTLDDFPSRVTSGKSFEADSPPEDYPLGELRGKSFRDYIRRKQMEMKQSK